MTIPYTPTERVLPNRTVDQAVDAASLVLNDRYNIKHPILDAVKNMKRDMKITLVQLNDISTDIIEASMRNAGIYVKPRRY